MYIIGEVFSNLNRNRVLTITSIFTVVIMLLLVGVFGMFLLTVSYNSEFMDDMLEVRIFVNPEADTIKEEAIRDSLIKDGRIDYLAFETKQQAFEEAKKIYDAEILDGLGADFLPASFTVRLIDEATASNFVVFAENLPDVYRVDYHENSFEFASSLTSWINLVTGILSILLGALSLFLISNTIKLTMASRSDEVIIMKFIGATEGRIKTPFIMEGITIGCTGAIVSTLIVSFLYKWMFDWFTAEGSTEMFLAGMRMVPVKESVMLMFIVFMGLGLMLGMFGSLMAIRKHLRV